jgi:arylsulfatase A-like enzyme
VSRPAGRVVRASIASSVAAAAIAAGAELATAVGGASVGALALGGAVIVALWGAFGIAIGLLQAAVLLAVAPPAGLESRARQIAAAVGEVARVGPANREVRRLAAAGAAGLAFLAGLAGLLVVAHRAARAIRPEPDSAVVLAAGAAVVVALAAVAFVAARDGLAVVVGAARARWGRHVSTRNAAVIVGILGAFGAIAAWLTLSALRRAVDFATPALALSFVALDLAFLIAALAGDRGATLARRVTGARSSIAVGGTLAVAWALALGPGSSDLGAVTVYRERAPVAGLMAAHIARALDRDGDGYSAYLGDGDCAPADSQRHPRAREIPDNGVDEDCFGGDLSRREIEKLLPEQAFPRPASLPEHPNVVIVILDSVRADHTSLLGYHRRTTPNLERLTARGASFGRAYASANGTRISFGSLFSSGFVDAARRANAGDRSVETLPAAFSRAGYRSVFITDLGRYLTKMRWRGFDSKRAFPDRADQAVEAAIQVLADHEEGKAFVVVHLLAAHDPYLWRPGAPFFGEGLGDRYDSQLALADQNLAPLIDRLESAALARNTIAVVIADHGEELGEHGGHFHGRKLYEESIRIPMIVVAPGAGPRRLDDDVVSMVDVAPTLINLAGLPPLTKARGHDLTGALFTGAMTRGRIVFAEQDNDRGGYQAAAITSADKLMEYGRSRTFELYDLAADPGERSNLIGRDLERYRRLRTAMSAFKSFD